MCATINIEFTDEELSKYAADVGRRVGLDFIHDVIEHIPALGKIDPKVASTFVGAIANAIAMRGASQEEPAPSAAPIDAEFAHDARCVYVPFTPEADDHWVCCKCDFVNNGNRTTCRKCKHECCAAVVTPPPAAGQTTNDDVAEGIR